MGDTTALVIANGDLIEAEALSRRLAGLAPRWIIAADGGCRHARRLGLRVDVLIGDLDSIEPEELPQLRAEGTQVISHPPDKDQTDLELALHHARALGASEIVVLGAIGDRLDMTLSNVLLLLHPSLRNIYVQLWHGSETAFVLRPPGGEIPGAIGDGVSLIPLAGDAAGVHTEGLAFPLAGETLKGTESRGVSNVVTSSPARVRLAEGTLLVVLRPGIEPGTEGS